MEEMDFYEAYS